MSVRIAFGARNSVEVMVNWINAGIVFEALFSQNVESPE